MLKREVELPQRGDYVVVTYPQLQALAARLRPLIDSTTSAANRAPLDYLLGAVHALFWAKALKYKKRTRKVFGDQPGRLDNAYWNPGPRQRVRQLADASVRLEGKWLAGWYFNSALVRLASVLDRVTKAQAVENGLIDGKGFALKAARRYRPPLEDLLSQLGWHRYWAGKLGAVYREVNKLKHLPEGLAYGRTVNDALDPLSEALDLVEARRTATRRW